MLRPSAFQNNGNSESASSSSKSILRPSSFQLAPSNLSAGSNKDECDEPSTSTDSTTTEVKITKDDDSKISSTTSNDGENSGESNEELEPNPFNNSKIKNADIDDDSETEAKSKSDDKNKENEKEKEKSENSEKPSDSPSALGTNLFASSNTKNLFAAAASKTNSMLNGSGSNFVLGQNIHERIVGVPDTSVASSSVDYSPSDSCSGSKLFAVSTSTSQSESTSNNGTGTPKESSTVEDLTKVAREYEESRAQKRKLDVVETFTGEENEINVLDMSCKLFAFSASNWEQRGPGSLRLNDVKTPIEGTDARSRVVFRTLGNFRVLINTKVFAGMIVERSNQKSLGLAAIDPNDGSVKIFLIIARPDDVTSLQHALKDRIKMEKKREKTQEASGSSVEANSSRGDDEPESKRERKN